MAKRQRIISIGFRGVIEGPDRSMAKVRTMILYIAGYESSYRTDERARRSF